jgi:hypothetical protein
MNADMEMVKAKTDRLPPIAILAEPPSDASLRAEIGEQVWSGVVLRFERTLSPEDRAKWKAQQPEDAYLIDRFDAFLRDMILEYGAKLFWSYGGLARLAIWETNSATLKEVWKKFEDRARIFEGRKCAPLPPDIAYFADVCIGELTRLLVLVKTDLFARPIPVTCERIAGKMLVEINARPTEFPVLWPSASLLAGFIENLPKLHFSRGDKAAAKLKTGRMQSRELFYLFYALNLNRSVKAIRNAVSGARKRAQLARN